MTSGSRDVIVTRIGVITPSSNTILEPVMARIAANSSPPVDLHFTRIRVTAIGLGAERVKQFDVGTMLDASGLLADLRPDVIVWAGTSGGWLGLDRDRAIARAIEEETKVPATTTTMANVELLQRHHVHRVGFATPYVPDVCDAIREKYSRLGLSVEVSGENVSDNRQIALIGKDRFESQVRALAAKNCDAICIYCTNVQFAEEAERLEEELGVLILDSVSVSYWGALRLAGRPDAVAGYGRIFRGA